MSAATLLCILEQNSAGANLVDGSSAVSLDHELAVAERAHPVDVGVDHNLGPARK